MNMLSLENVCISYKKKKEIFPIIHNFSLTINEGEAMVILGPSGCGKSTLVNALAGTLSTESGKVEFIKENKRKKLNPKSHKIGIIPQNYGLLPWKTVKANSILPLKIRQEKISASLIQKMNAIYESLNISHLLNKYPKELSGGQVQRAAIARAFILNPDLLLMDEPFSALDAITREEARELFLTIWKQNRPTTILVTHSIEEALYLANTIIVMGKNNGDITYRMNNPFFGKLDPKSRDYQEAKQLLREKLKSKDEKVGKLGTINEAM